MEKGSGTRSGLLWEVERLLKECDELPQVLLMENVTQVHSKKNIEHFNQWIKALEDLGYSNYWQDLNAKNYGIPQNRNRTFMVSILGNYTYEFPKPFELKLKLKDMLESDVAARYYTNKTLNVRFTEKYIQWSNSGKMQNSQAERAYYIDNECMCTMPNCNSNGDKTQIVLADKNDCLEMNNYTMPREVVVKSDK
jgi:site-specific DNA-cytosine methylase